MRRVGTVMAAAGLLLLGGCAGGTDDTNGGAGSTASASGPVAVTGTVNVFAAASLTEAFTQLGKDFEAANPGAKVTFNFAGSSALATQINNGAPADVFASAAPTNMQTVIDAGNVTGTATTF